MTLEEALADAVKSGLLTVDPASAKVEMVTSKGDEIQVEVSCPMNLNMVHIAFTVDGPFKTPKKNVEKNRW